MILSRFRKFHVKSRDHPNPLISFVYRNSLYDTQSRISRNLNFMYNNLLQVEQSFNDYLNANEPLISILKELIACRDGGMLVPNLSTVDMNEIMYEICVH